VSYEEAASVRSRPRKPLPGGQRFFPVGQSTSARLDIRA
jgi:hypothetical protein